MEIVRTEVSDRMTDSLEIERKFDIPDGFRLPSLDAIGRADKPHAFDLDATYYDTADLRLMRHRLTLRRRLGGHDAGWHLKRPAGGDRTEQQLPDAPQVPPELLDQIRAIIRDEPLQPVVRLQTRRIEVGLASGDDEVSIAIDTVHASRYGRTMAEIEWSELEIELVKGSRSLIDRLAAEVEAAGARPSAFASKLSRALGDAVPAKPVSGATAATRALAGYLRMQRDELIANDPLVRGFDADGVHDMRVAVRRLRSALSTFRKPDSAHLRAELKWLSDLIGAVRDTDVLADELIGDIAVTAPDLVPSKVTRRIRQRLRRDTAAAREALRAALNGPRYFALLDELDALVDGEAVEVSRTWLHKRTRKRLAAADAELTAALVSRDDAELHEARKSYKKARYAVEVAGPHKGRTLAKRLKELQEILGAHQDAVVAAELLKELADEAEASSEPEFGLGVLYAHQQQQAADRSAEVPAAYSRARKRKIRRWLG